MSTVATILRPRIPQIYQKRWTTFLTIVLGDLVALVASVSSAIALRYLTHGQFAASDYLMFGPTLALFPMAFAALGLYPGVGLNPVEELRRIISATTISFLVIVSGTFLAKSSANYSRAIFSVAWILSVILLAVCRTAVREYCSKKSWWGIPVVVLGAGETGHQVISILNRQKTIGLRPIAMLDDDPGRLPQTTGRKDGPVYGQLALAPMLASDHDVRYAIVAMPSLSSKDLSKVVSTYARGFAHVLIIPNLFGMSSLWVAAKDVGGLLGLEVSQTLIRPVPQLLKRGSDLMLSAAISLLLLPLLLLLYLTVRLSSAGPAFYGQRRIGLDCQPFTTWKFRSMVVNADEALEKHLMAHPALQEEWKRDQKLKNDPRVTWIGRILRKTSLDELPQIWNILCGEMSLVGPRPIVSAEILKYGECFELYKQVRPGLTGLWQVSGRNNTSYLERVRLDEYYVRNWSILLDLYILGRTVKTVLFTEGAY